MQLLFIDTETSGIEADDRIVQIAYKTPTKTVNELFKPPVPIKPEASAITHITDKHVADKPAFKNSDTCLDLLALADKSIFIAHNADFDLKMLEKEGIIFPRFIDTLKIARHIDDGTMVNHQLQYLRYYYDLDIDLGPLSPHDALADIIVLEAVFKVLGKKLMEKEEIVDKANAIARMIDISSRPSLLKYPPFGKYSKYGAEPTLFSDLKTKDNGYLVWMYGAKKDDAEPNVDLLYTLQYYLR
jgi:DNA polymerase III epsilon subunit-like protein